MAIPVRVMQDRDPRNLGRRLAPTDDRALGRGLEWPGFDAGPVEQHAKLPAGAWQGGEFPRKGRDVECRLYAEAARDDEIANS